MQRPDTEDGLFHAGDPLTGTRGTPITAEWLNALLAVGALFHGEASPPGPEIGDDGDHYLNTAAMTLYGPKAGGAWPAGVSLKGDGLYKTYATLALANADFANIPNTNGLIWVNADTVVANNGYWAKSGGVLVQSTYDRVALVEAKAAGSAKDLSEVFTKRRSVNLFDRRSANQNGYYTNGAVFNPSAIYGSTDYIPVTPSQVLTKGDALNATCIFYDAAFAQVAWNTSAGATITAPGTAGIAYMRVKFTLAIIDTLMIVNGNATYLPAT